jgi:exonuclease V gamma subunit
VRRRLSERGLVPLAYWGRRWLAERWEDLDALLSCRFQGLGSLGDAIRAQEAGEKQECEIALASGAKVSGTLVTVSGLAVDFRCATVSPAYRLAAWLRHVFACSAGVAEVRWHVQGPAPEKLEAVRFDALDSAQATDWLRMYAEAFLAGRLAVPPFTAATAHAFVQALRKKPDDPDGRDRALKAAQRAWYSQEGYRFSDDLDPYFRKEFGPDGPFRDPDAFAALAVAWMGPLVEHGEAVSPEEEGGAKP